MADKSKVEYELSMLCEDMSKISDIVNRLNAVKEVLNGQVSIVGECSITAEEKGVSCMVDNLDVVYSTLEIVVEVLETRISELDKFNLDHSFTLKELTKKD